MSKGHVEQLRALREAKFRRSPVLVVDDKPYNKPITPGSMHFVKGAKLMDVTNSIDAHVTKSKGGKRDGAGRPKTHASDAERQRACRSRKKQAAS